MKATESPRLIDEIPMFHPAVAKTLNLLRSGDFAGAKAMTGTLLKIGEQAGKAFASNRDALTAFALVAEIDYTLDELGRKGDLFRYSNDVLLTFHPKQDESEEIVDGCVLTARCFFVLQYAKFRYHDREYDQARIHLEAATRGLEGLSDLAPSINDERHTVESERRKDTLILLYYWQGNVCRELQKYDDAVKLYQTSMDHIRRSLEAPHSESFPTLCLFRLGNVLTMGLGWTSYRAGDLTSAKSCLLAAQPLMKIAAGPDSVRRGYSSMLLGSVLRAEAGASNKRLLQRAVELFDIAYKDFLCPEKPESPPKSQHMARVHCELAAAYAHSDELGDLEEAGNHAGVAIECADASGHRESSSLAHILKSRINRKLASLERDVRERAKKLTGALKDARLAEMEARDIHHESLEFEARIEQGEVYFTRAELLRQPLDERHESFRDAIEQFERAAQSAHHARHRSVCTLHLARTHSRLGQSRRARQYLEDYEREKEGVQNGFIRDFAKTVRFELEQTSLVLDPREILRELHDGEKLYDVVQNRVKEFMVKYVKQSGNQEESIKELGVSRQTFFTWKGRSGASRPKSDSDQET